MSERAPSSEVYRAYEPEDYKERKWRGSAKWGFGIIAGVVTAMGINYKLRGSKFQTSLYVIHTRMIMQGSVLGFLTIAMLNEMWKKYQKGQYIWGDKYITDGLTKDHEEKSRQE